MKNKLYKLPPVILCLLLCVFLTAAPEKAAETVLRAMKLCALRLIPSLFPFFVLSSLIRGVGIARTLSRLLNKPFQLLFGVSGSGALPLILGFLGGYPVGVKTVCDMTSSGEITKQEASRLLLFCGNTGPAFIIGAAGAGLFGSVNLGLTLYLIHILSAVFLGILCRIFIGKTDISSYKLKSTESLSFSSVFTQSVSGGIASAINISAYVMIFSVLTGLADYFGITDLLCSLASAVGADPVRARSVITGFTELGSGLDALTPFARDISFSLPACAFILAWGGVSVHCQAMSFITPAGLKGSSYVLSKLLHGILAAVFTALFVRFGGAADVFSFWGHSSAKEFIFDYLGLFFSVSCAAAALILHIIRRFKHRHHQL